MGNIEHQEQDINAMFGIESPSSDSLLHFGVPGMKWGVRKQRETTGSGSKRSTKEKLSRIKKAISNYKRNKRLKKINKKRRAQAKKDARKNARLEKKLQKIMRDPALLYKYRHKFSEDQLNKAISRYKAEEELHKYSINHLNKGKAYIDMVVGYAESIYKGYEVYKKVTGSDKKDSNQDNKPKESKKSRQEMKIEQLKRDFTELDTQKNILTTQKQIANLQEQRKNNWGISKKKKK